MYAWSRMKNKDILHERLGLAEDVRYLVETEETNYA
jgi:hypothetical protein